MKNRIVKYSSIWDLHIHSNMCSSSKYGLDTATYIDELLKVFSAYDYLEMISFTDHNVMNYEVYREFLKRKSEIVLIPGIEIDVMVNGIEKSKHMVVYFECPDDEIKKLTEIINKIMKDYNVSPKKPIDLAMLLNEFITNGLIFTISPHAFKTEDRDISADWNSEESDNEPHKFTDQFFNFWEASGTSNIARAQEYLAYMNLQESISIVSFSDSKDFKKLRKYLDNPPCYFNSLPSFKGLQLVGSESRRITRYIEKIDITDKEKLIGYVEFEGEKIEFSRRLNTVIGGRGSGKSILVDKIGTFFNDDVDLDDSRIEYLKKFDLKVFDSEGNKINDTFSVNYFDQNYVSKIYKSGDRNKELSRYFKNEFSVIKNINKELKISEIKNYFDNEYEEFKKIFPEGNIGDLEKSFKNLIDDKLDIGLLKKYKKKTKLIEDFDFDLQYKKMISPQIIPKLLKEEKDIKNAIERFRLDILKSIRTHNTNILDDDFIFNSLIDNYTEYKENASKEAINKKSTTQQIEKELAILSKRYIDNMNLVMALCNTELNSIFDFKEINDENSIERFEFTKELKVESVIDYFIRIFENNVSFKKFPKEKMNRSNLLSMFNVFCFDLDDHLSSSKTYEDMYEEIISLKLKSEDKHVIYYEGIDINNESPGTQTNILMEYIVLNDSTIPLIIDQPEDNIDNLTIFDSLVTWFYEMKLRRQIIVVTHDANIAINADSENIVIANNDDVNKFSYRYGALEYHDNLLMASKILDGGIPAVRRRLGKYGDRKDKDSLQ